jgi:hypothetical protein
MLGSESYLGNIKQAGKAPVETAKGRTMYSLIRERCAPPMVLMSEVDIGEIWYYDGCSMAVLLCKGPQSLLVAYYGGESNDDAEFSFRVASEWLQGDRDQLPDEPWYRYELVYAAFERDGRLAEPICDPGDWMGLGWVATDIFTGEPEVELPPRRSDVPYGWNSD